VLLDALEHPSDDALVSFLNEHLRTRTALVQVFGTCEVSYVGRAASFADAGDLLVMVKPDGSLQVHRDRGVKPVNWQPRVDDLWVGLDEGQAVLVAERRTPEEMLRVVFLEVALAQALHLSAEVSLVLQGTEAQMQASLARAPEVIEVGLRVLDRELPTEVGGIDLFARDRDGRLVVVELKRGKANHAAVHQLQRYVQAVTRITGEPVRGILAAPTITKPALLVLSNLSLEYVAVAALPSFEPDTAQPGLF
jgi:RecB family endonuclease NucS